VLIFEGGFMSQIRPILDKLLVRVNKGEAKTESGLIISAKTKENEPVIGTVDARGPGGNIDGKDVKMYVEKGDKVIINKYSGTDISFEGKDYKIVSQRDILAIVC